MSKSLAMIALAVGLVAITAGSALADCSGMHTAQSVSLETQTASTGSGTLQQTPKTETKAN